MICKNKNGFILYEKKNVAKHEVVCSMHFLNSVFKMKSNLTKATTSGWCKVNNHWWLIKPKDFF